MKRIVSILTVLVIGFGLPLVTQASPESDLQAFQSYFMKKFPKVKFEEFSNGLYALPGAEDRRAEWEGIMDFPPYEIDLVAARKFWDKNGLGSCFENGGVKIAQHYPYWDKKQKKVITIVGAINDCLKSKGQQPIKDLKKGKMAQLAAYMKSLSRGQKVAIDLSDPGMRAVYEEGKKFYWAKRGQLNFSCADCHVRNAGRFVGGNILSAGLGHGVGFPAYRSKWGGLGTLHRRYGGCNKNIRAKPLKAQGKEYIALEVYETYMNTGLPLEAPSQRF